MAMGAVYSLWESNHCAGQSRRGQDHFCPTPCRRLHHRGNAAGNEALAAIPSNLPDRRGRAGRYRQATLEARKLDIPVIGLVDTNCNPEDVDYAIPGNDDAIRAVKLIADVMANAVIEGRQGESFENAEEQDISEEATDMEQVVEETAE